MNIEFVKEDKLRDMLFRNLKNHRLPDYLLNLGDGGKRNRLSLESSREFGIPGQLTGLLDEKMRFVAESIPDGVSVVSLGVGDGEKEAILLRDLAKKGKVEYCAMDINSGMLDNLMRRIEGEGTGVKKTAYVGLFDDLPRLRPLVHSPMLLCCLNNGFCGQEPGPFLSMVHANLAAADLFLLDCHLYNAYEPPEQESSRIESMYRSSESRDCAVQPFIEFGLQPDNFEFRMDLLTAHTPAGQAYRTRKTLQIRKDCKLSVDAGSLALRKGDEIEIGSTYKYKFSQVVALLKRARFQIVRLFLSDDNENLIVLARPLEEGFLQMSVLGR